MSDPLNPTNNLFDVLFLLMINTVGLSNKNTVLTPFLQFQSLLVSRRYLLDRGNSPLTHKSDSRESNLNYINKNFVVLYYCSDIKLYWDCVISFPVNFKRHVNVRVI